MPFGLPPPMTLELPVFQLHMVDRARCAAHAAADLRALERRACRRGARRHSAVRGEHHLAVRADVHHQRRLLRVIQPRRQHAAHRVAADVAGDVRHGQQQRIRADGQNGRSLLRLRPRQNRRKRDLRQIFGRDAEEELLHAGVADHGDHADALRRNARLGAHAPDEIGHSGADAGRQRPLLVAEGVLDPGDHIRAVGRLRVEHACARKLLAGFAGEQVAHHRRGADVKRQQRALAHRRHRHLLDAPLGQDALAGSLFRQRDRQVLRNDRLAGAHLARTLAVRDEHTAFAAGAVAAAGRLRRTSRALQHVQKRFPRLCLNCAVLRTAQADLISHGIPPLYYDPRLAGQAAAPSPLRRHGADARRACSRVRRIRLFL